jgi:RimJ/RimL family protein N-acetyltransferase
MSRTVPTINTARLTLRAMRTEDFARFAEIWAMPEALDDTSAAPRGRARSWDAFLQNAGHWQIAGFGQWAVQVHGMRGMAGQAGFFFGARGFGEDFDPFPEAGWLLDPALQGRGLGLEAARAAHDWFDRVIAGRTVCVMPPDNNRAMEIAETLGYRPLRAAALDQQEVLLMTRRGPPV